MKRPLPKYLAVFFGLIAAYLLFALAANLLPNKPILRHAARTIEHNDLQNDFAFAVTCRPQYYMDNFTDALIINQACNGGSSQLLTSMLLIPRVDYGGEQCESLRRFTQGDTSYFTVHYGRYWHGSTFLMRFLLLIGDYVSLRILFYLLSTLLLAWVAVALYRHIGTAAMLLYMLALAMVNVFMMQLSIQFLLTCPMMTWGLPMCVFLMKQHRTPHCPKPADRLKTWTLSSLLWMVGYGLTWVSKWFIATVLTGENVIRDGAKQFAVRAGQGIDYSRWDAVGNNLNLIRWPYVALTIMLLLAIMVWRFNRTGLPTALLCLLTALPPLLWYLVTADHSYLHYWFTYRSLSVPLTAIFFAIAAIVDWPRIAPLPTHKRRKAS